MGHTNSTTYYNLPQFLTTDKPAWLVDINGAFSDIDSGIHAAQSDATTAGNNATQAISDASSAATAASAADAKGAGACSSIEAAFDSTAVYAVGAKVMYNSLLYRCTVAVTTPGAWTGSNNWERITVNSIIPYDASELPLGSTTPAGSTAAAIANLQSAVSAIPDIKSILLTGTISSTASDTATIGFRNTTANAIDLTTISGYPTGKTILGYCIENVSYNGVSGGIGFITGTTLSVNTKISGTYDFKVRVIYKD